VAIKPYRRGDALTNFFLKFPSVLLSHTDTSTFRNGIFEKNSMGKLLYLPGDQKQPSGNQLVTLDDLEKFRVNLLMDIRKILDGQLSKPPKRWLKSREVRKLLNISGGTLQTLRNTGQLPFKRVGGLMFYDAAEIDLTLTSPKKLTR
jgi:hypothetical protein